MLTERRRYHDAPYDIQPIRDASLDDLDLDLFRDSYLPAAVAPAVLAENNRTLPQQLASLRLLAGADPSLPTVLGLLVLGRQPRKYLPMAYVSFIRLAGTAMASEVITAHDLQGPLPKLMAQVDELLRLHIFTRVDITSAPTERQYPDYPLPALQQIIRNAVMHRIYEGTNAPIRIYWFADRVEIISPGGPFGLVTAANFGQPGISDYRNPHLAEAMRHLGYAQHFGVGIQIARDAMHRNDNPPLQFQVEARTIRATLPRSARLHA